MKGNRHYRALTIQALWMRREIYHGFQMGRDEFDRVYLNGIGDYERRVARQEGVPLDGEPAEEKHDAATP